ncbi:MAG: hypothetical protein DRI61_11395 [Chloroflexi bacterium]|nr:MAG: hypothetical protein DRI61_11395 [Chloroflexota bacterium]
MNREDRIRKRMSYRRWKRFLDFLNTNPSKAEILRRIHDLIDLELRGYGYATHSMYAKESLEQLIKDEGLEQEPQDEIMKALDDFYHDIDEVMKKHGFEDIAQAHDNGSMVRHFYNKKLDVLIIIEEQQMPDGEILEGFGITIKQ